MKQTSGQMKQISIPLWTRLATLIFMLSKDNLVYTMRNHMILMHNNANSILIFYAFVNCILISYAFHLGLRFWWI